MPKPNVTKKETKPVTDQAVVVKALNTPKRVSHLKLGPALLAQKATPEQIAKAFTVSFNARGVTDAGWIAKRAAIYMKIATRKAALVAPAASKAK